jgi:hypothetical protein
MSKSTDRAVVPPPPTDAELADYLDAVAANFHAEAVGLAGSIATDVEHVRLLREAAKAKAWAARLRAVVPPPPDTAAAPTEPTEGEKRLRRLCALRRKVRNCMASSEGEAACDHYLIDLEDAVREDARLRAACPACNRSDVGVEGAANTTSTEAPCEASASAISTATPTGDARFAVPSKHSAPSSTAEAGSSGWSAATNTSSTASSARPDASSARSADPAASDGRAAPETDDAPTEPAADDPTNERRLAAIWAGHWGRTLTGERMPPSDERYLLDLIATLRLRAGRAPAPATDATTWMPITFDELVAHGLANGANVVNGMPWSFRWHGYPVTHETDNLYLIITPLGTYRLARAERLVVPVAAPTTAAVELVALTANVAREGRDPARGAYWWYERTLDTTQEADRRWARKLLASLPSAPTTDAPTDAELQRIQEIAGRVSTRTAQGQAGRRHGGGHGDRPPDHHLHRGQFATGRAAAAGHGSEP